MKRHSVRDRAPALLLDFDGTLSPIVPHPEDAYLPVRTRSILKEINRAIPVCIITGRPLSVIRKKVGIRGLSYGASHGLEWDFGNASAVRRRLPRFVLRALANIRRDVRRLKIRYPRLINEPKPFAVTFHYHLLSKSDIRSFTRDVEKILVGIESNSNLRIFRDKKTVDIVPSLNWTKGDAARLFLRHLTQNTGRRFFPVYIGDSTADEDVFRALKRGVTIRVGTVRKSAARYYFRTREEVDSFLSWFATATATSLPRIRRCLRNSPRVLTPSFQFSIKKRLTTSVRRAM